MIRDYAIGKESTTFYINFHYSNETMQTEM